MEILAIETSCDETAIAVLEAGGGFEAPYFKVLSHNLYSQASKHAKFGGVYPNLAKREHSKNLIPLLKKTLKESNFLQVESSKLKVQSLDKITKTLERNPELLEQTIEFLPTISIPPIDAIVVTEGPGLEPALWVGITFAEALGEFWGKPVIGVDHMEGHIYSVLINGIKNHESLTRRQVGGIINQSLNFPAIALLISGGHTELVLVKNWREYEILGATRDDAVGEAFDKTARVLGLPYPGGPEISRLAEEARRDDLELSTSLPRPMINSNDFDFSFSGLKTAVLYYEKEYNPLSKDHKKKLAREIEDAIKDVLLSKTENALLKTSAKTLIVAGGVIANKYLRESFEELIDKKFKNVSLHIPEHSLSTDNAVMIGMAGYLKTIQEGIKGESNLKARGNLKLTD